MTINNWDNFDHTVEFANGCLINNKTGAEAPFLISGLYYEALKQACGLLAVAGPDYSMDGGQEWLDFFMTCARKEMEDQTRDCDKPRCCGGGCHSESDDDSGLI
jgi:hypothetical protein